MIRAHRRVPIPSRALAAGIGATLVVGALLSARAAEPTAADPPREASRRASLLARAAEAEEALAALDAALASARDAARRGAALVQAGDEEPAPALREAADLVAAAAPEADRAAQRIDELRGVIAAVATGHDIPPVPAGAELEGIAEQLRSAAEAAGPFVERRRAASRTLGALEEALAALEDGDLDLALDALDGAAAARERVADWERPPPTLPLWLSTTDELIGAARAMAEAALAGDRPALDRAARRYAAAAEDARRADVSLALSLSETGASLTATPLQRLARVLAAVEAARAAVASLVQGTP